MAANLVDTITSKTDSQLYDMVESGWSATFAKVEIARRGIPSTRPKVKVAKSKVSRGIGHARRRCGVTGGYVDVEKITVGNLRAPMPGQNVEPWNRHATGRA